MLDEINQLTHRLSSLEARRIGGKRKREAVWFDRINVNGMVEVEGSIFGNQVKTGSDIVVATNLLLGLGPLTLIDGRSPPWITCMERVPTARSQLSRLSSA